MLSTSQSENLRSNKKQKFIALVDCNNFYVSCERVFEPRLRNRPVVVLSNNDGCIVSRSDEAKRLGIPMAAPYFKWKAIMEANRVEVFSSNYSFYGDLSKRVMQTLHQLSPEVEIRERFHEPEPMVSPWSNLSH